MGAGSSVPETEDEALSLGYTRQEIDEYLANNPDAKRTSRDLHQGIQALEAKPGLHSEAKYNEQHKQLRDDCMSEIDQFCELFDTCGGDYERIAEQLPHTDAAKMQAHYEGKMKLYAQSKNTACKTTKGSAKYTSASFIFAAGHVEGLFYKD
jgi:hypothetical protein